MIEQTTPSKQGGKRAGSGRRARDGATGVTNVSIALEPVHREFLDRQPEGRAGWVRKMINSVMEHQKKAAK